MGPNKKKRLIIGPGPGRGSGPGMQKPGPLPFLVLWHDHWHPDGILNQRYGPRVIYIYATSLFGARVDFVLRNKHWVQKAARSE